MKANASGGMHSLSFLIAFHLHLSLIWSVAAAGSLLER